jgi:phenylacetate-CoA ligase
MVTAGTLFPEVRDKVEQVFGAPIFNRYGSREVGDMASECDHHHGLHVVPNTHYIEILREDGTPCEPGETGEIVVTLLSNYAMPLIRYRIGDRGAWATQACTCGRNLPLLERVEGRVVDIIRTLHGNVIDGTVFNKIFYFRKWINKFQVVQEEADKFTISIVPESMTDSPERKYADDLKDIQLMLEQTMKHPVAIDFRFVPDIPPSASGKYRYIMSKVDSP